MLARGSSPRDFMNSLNYRPMGLFGGPSTTMPTNGNTNVTNHQTDLLFGSGNDTSDRI